MLKIRIDQIVRMLKASRECHRVGQHSLGRFLSEAAQAAITLYVDSYDRTPVEMEDHWAGLLAAADDTAQAILRCDFIRPRKEDTPA